MRYLLLTLFFIPSLVLSVGFQDIVITLEPELPAPGEEVIASVESYAYDLTRSEIVWYLDGVAQGIGQTLPFTTPAQGESSELTVVVGTQTISRTITPAQVDLLLEADTYIPTFYRGRALPSSGSRIHAVALAYTTYAENELVYKWRVNERTLTEKSGIGKRSITLDAPDFLGSYLLVVEVQDRSGVVLARNGVRIESIRPEIMTYGISPLIGTVTYTTSHTDPGGTRTVVPFFFSIANPSELTYIETKTNTSVVVRATHPDELLQSATTQLDTETIAQDEGVRSRGGVVPVSPFGI